MRHFNDNLQLAFYNPFYNVVKISPTFWLVYDIIDCATKNKTEQNPLHLFHAINEQLLNFPKSLYLEGFLN